MKSLFALLVFACAANAEKKISTSFLLRELIKIEKTELDLKDEKKGCKSAAVGIKNVGDYLSFLISSLDPNNGQSGVTSDCEVNIGSTNCVVNFATGLGTQSPWKYGIRFTLLRSGKINPKTIECPGGS